MSARARDVVRYLKAIDETGGWEVVYRDGGSWATRQVTHDHFRAHMLDMADLTDGELMGEMLTAGVVITKDSYASILANARARVNALR